MAADDLWRQLDPALWDLIHNPWVVLQTVSRDQLKKVLAEPGFRKKVEDLVEAKSTRRRLRRGFNKSFQSSSDLRGVFQHGVHVERSAAYLFRRPWQRGRRPTQGRQRFGVPVVGVGLLYQQGYFRQVICKGGFQEALYPYNDPGQLPITPVRQPKRRMVAGLEVRLPGYSLWLRAWQVQVGRVKLLLARQQRRGEFSGPPRASPASCTRGDSELRLKQELALGIGGWRLLKALGLRPEVLPPQ